MDNTTRERAIRRSGTGNCLPRFRVLALAWTGCLAVAVAWSSGASLAMASDRATYDFHFERDSLGDVLAMLGHRLGIQVQVADGVEGTVSGRFTDADPREILDLLVESHDLVQFKDGVVLLISPPDAQDWHEIQLRHAPAVYVRQRLEELGVFDRRFAWDEVNGGVRIYGPAEYIKRVRFHAEEIDQEAANHRLVYRWVDERGQIHMSDLAPSGFEDHMTVQRLTREDQP